MSGQYEYRYPEPENAANMLRPPQPNPEDLPVWRFPDPLPDPLPHAMALDLIRAHVKDCRATLESLLSKMERLQYEASSLDALFGYVEQTLREAAG